jgi:hypothetical protein
MQYLGKIAGAFLIVAAAIYLSTPAFALAAFGVSPPFLNADHLVRGSRYVQTIYLVQDNPSEDLKIVADLEINDRVRSWFTVNNGQELIIPKGTRQFPVVIEAKIPENADLGLYHGSISFKGMPARTGQVTIALGVEVAINLTVGEGIFRKYDVPLIKFLDIEEGWSPRVYVKFNNEGNIPESFDSATYELYDQFGAVKLAYIQKSDKFPETPPFSVDEYTMEFPVDFHLGIGQYWGSVSFYKEGAVIASQRTVFNVLKRGSLSGPLDQVFRFVKQNLIAVEGAGVAIVLLMGVAIMWRRKRRRARG